jgi:hypothetical protein
VCIGCGLCTSHPFHVATVLGMAAVINWSDMPSWQCALPQAPVWLLDCAVVQLTSKHADVHPSAACMGVLCVCWCSWPPMGLQSAVGLHVGVHFITTQAHTCHQASCIADGPLGMDQACTYMAAALCKKWEKEAERSSGRRGIHPQGSVSGCHVYQQQDCYMKLPVQAPDYGLPDWYR